MGTTASSILNPTRKFKLPAVPSQIPYVRQNDYTSSGLLREEVPEEWEKAIRSMISEELTTRALLASIIKERLDTLKKLNEYNESNVSSIIPKFPQWNEDKILEYHDIFQMFEGSDDCRIDTYELILDVTNLNDKSPLSKRLETIRSRDDGTGHITFEDFLKLMLFLEKEGASSPLRETFQKLQNIQRYIRHMTVVQQILTGFL